MTTATIMAPRLQLLHRKDTENLGGTQQKTREM